jgi:hypothetical protein
MRSPYTALIRLLVNWKIVKEIKSYKLLQLVVSLAAVLDIVPSFKCFYLVFPMILFVNTWNSVPEM